MYSARCRERAAADLAEELLELGHTVVEALDHRIDLGAQAGRQEDRLGEVRLVPEAAERLGKPGVGHRDPVEEVGRGVLLFEADDDHRHGGTVPVVARFTRSVT